MIPAFINSEAGTARQAAEHIKADARFILQQVTARELPGAVQEALRHDASRILVCGGDGTLALAARQLVGTNTELAVFPGGTLNHFAVRIGLPTQPEELLDIASNGSPSMVDIGYVNDHVFLNTSSIGAYVHFVRTRNYLEKRMGYTFASMLAGVRRLVRLRSIHIDLEDNVIRTPLVFVGVGERELSFPFLGKDKIDGQRGLHLIALLSANRLETLSVAFNAMLRGIDPLSKAREVEDRVLTSVELDYAKRKRIAVALDGEIYLLKTPLCYSFLSDAISVVGPKQ